MAPPKRSLSPDFDPSWLDVSLLSGRWFTHYLKGMGHKLSSYRDCISLNLTITSEGDSYLIEIKDKRRMGTSSDYVMVKETFRCQIDSKLQNVTMARDKKLSVMSC